MKCVGAVALGVTAVLVLSATHAASASGSISFTPTVAIGKLSPDKGATHTAIWNSPPSITWFRSIRGTGKDGGIQQTEVRLAYDQSNLYVAFRCSEPDLEKLHVRQTRQDDPVYTDDSVEIFLDTRHDHKSYLHLIANAAGVTFDGSNESQDPKSWDCEWSVDVRKERGAWTALAAIPFRSLGVSAPPPGAVWGANFCRYRPRDGEEFSCWSQVKSSFHEPENFGDLVFQAAGVTASVAPVDIRSPGKHPVTVRLWNRTAGEVDLEAEVLLDGKHLATFRETVSPGRREWRLPLDLRSEGGHQLGISISSTERSTRQVVLQVPVSVDIPSHRATLSHYQKLVAQSSPCSPEAGKEKAAARDRLNEIAAFARTAEGSNEKWDELGARLQGVKRSVFHARYASADKNGCGYVVGAESSLVKVFRDREFEGDLGGPAKISVCRNEYEAAQAVIVAYRQTLKGVSVSVSPLKGPGGALIGTDKITTNLVDYVRTRKPPYQVEFVGWYPDPLMNTKPFDVPAGNVQPVWITVHPSEDAPAGIYRGNITIKPADARGVTMPIEVQVWSFTLPKQWHLKTAFSLSVGWLKNWYGKQWSHDILLRYYQFLLDHRLNPTDIYATLETIPSKEDLPFCIERGLNAFCLFDAQRVSRSWGKDRVISRIEEYEPFLKEKGWWDKAYVYGFDEIDPPDYPKLTEVFGYIKESFPDLPRVCTVRPCPELKGCVDVWVPRLEGFRPDVAEEYTRAGDRVWWYTCLTPPHPFPNFFLDYPSIDSRIVFWMNWKYHVPGFLYYSLNQWYSNYAVDDVPAYVVPPEDPKVREAIRAGKRWPEVPWNTFTGANFNGEGSLIYPGPDGSPISSIRLECIRDGIEDYEYLYLLNSLVEQAERAGARVDPALLTNARGILKVKGDVAKSLVEYTLDPAVLLAARAEVARTIEALQTALIQGPSREAISR